MATSSFSIVAQDDLSCPVCFELLRDPNTPKLLDCPHVCCAMCIQKMIKGGRKVVECPECRHITRIPREGVTAMKTNLRVRSLAEKHEIHMVRETAYPSTNSDQSKQTLTTSTGAVCPEHNIAIEFYCENCNVAACSSCMMKRHIGPPHTVQEIKIARKGQKNKW